MTNQENLKEFDKYYYETYQNVSKYVVCNCSNIEDAKDIIQNIYFELYKQLRRKKIIINDLTYVMGIARHKVKDYYRFQYKRKIVTLFLNKANIDLTSSIQTKVNIEKDFITKEDIHKIWEYLKEKDVIISKIFYLYYCSNTTIREIANMLGLTESNVKNHLYRTRKELNILLREGE